MFERLKATAVHAAAQRIAPHIGRTRLLRSGPLSSVNGGDVYLKLENEQITGSFKLRGALNALFAHTKYQLKNMPSIADPMMTASTLSLDFHR